MALLLFALFALDGQGQAMLDPLREKILRPAELVARLALSPDAVIADVGAGPGFFVAELARAVPRGQVIATDIRRDYLDVVAAKKLRNVITRVVPPDDPSLRSIDVAFLCQVDQYLRDRADYFAKLATALRPGGRIVLVNYLEHRAAGLAALKRVGLHVTDEWQPSPGFFMLVASR